MPRRAPSSRLTSSPPLSADSSPALSQSGLAFSAENLRRDPSPSPPSTRSSAKMPAMDVSDAGDMFSIRRGAKIPASATAKPKSERQTRLQEHLRAVKPGSSTSSTGSVKSASSVAANRVLRNNRRKVVVEQEEDEEDEEELRTPTKRIAAVESAAMEVDVIALSEEEVQSRLDQEKEELMTRLALYGLKPQPNILDHALRTMPTDGTGASVVTVESFLQTLTSLDPSSSTTTNGVLPPTSLEPTTPVTPRKSKRHHVSFSTLEPSSAQSPPRYMTDGESSNPSPPTSARSYAGGPPTTPTRSSSAADALAPSPAIVQSTTPSALRRVRLKAFAPRPTGTSSMVAAEVQGMGRVAMTREILFERLGSVTAEQAIAAATAEPGSPLGFGIAGPSTRTPLMDAFAPRDPTVVTKATTEAGVVVVVDARMSQVRSWLDSPEVVEEESREAWSTIPKEWDADLDAYEKERLLRLASPAEGEGEDEEVEEIRVGGKSVRILLKTKRRRVLEDEEEQGEMEAVEDGDVSEIEESAPRQGRSARISAMEKGKGRAVTRSSQEVSCVCGRSDEGEDMVRCDDCTEWYHLECVNVPSSRRAAKEWFCFRCTADPTPTGPSPSKRSRPATSSPAIPVSEPTLVETACSPRPRGNFYDTNGADLVLAPSPHASPSRRSVPTVAAPVTPTLGGLTRADYSPRSPLFYRSGRTRLQSGAFEDAPAAFHSSFVGTWDGLTFEDPGVVAPLEEEYFHPRTWNDMTMTPSRTLCSSALGWGEPPTPNTSSRRRGAPSTGNMTPSQDFLSGLHHHPASDESTPQGVAQRVFSGPAAHHVPSSTHAAHYSLSSPLGPKGGRPLLSTGHRRMPSIPSIFPSSSSRTASNPFTSPDRRLSASRASQYTATTSPKLQREEATKVQLPPTPGSAGEMVRSASGLGIGCEGGELEDLLAL